MSSCAARQFHAMQSDSFHYVHGHRLCLIDPSTVDYAINNKLTPFISIQNYHSLIYREEEREMNAVCKVCLTGWCGSRCQLTPGQQLGVVTIPWSLLSRELLTLPRDKADSTHRSKADGYRLLLQKNNDPNLAIIDRSVLDPIEEETKF
jgi:hypothetical protein